MSIGKHVRILGLDIGERRIGVAVSDTEARVATPIAVVAGPLSSNPAGILSLIDEWEAGAVVVGLPLSLDGSEGPQAELVRREAQVLAELSPVPLIFEDERLTTVEARRVLDAAGVNGRRRRGSIDKMAATIVLQAFLDAGGAARIDQEGSDD